jgi:hypothetical protein
MATDFKFLVDWNNDGDFSDTNEDITDYVMSANWSLGFSEPYQHVAGETRLDLQLTNKDKRFSPEGTASPMAGSILPNRLVKIQNTASGTVDLYTGYIESITPSPGVAGDLRCRIVGVGIKQFLDREEYYSPFWESVTTDDVLNDILINTTLPPVFGDNLIIDLLGHNLIDTHWISETATVISAEEGQTTFPYVGDTWEDGVKAMRAISDLVNSDRGWFYNDRSGSAIYWNRHHLFLNSTLQGTVDNTWADMDYRYSIDDIKNIIRVANYPRSISAGSAEILWQLDATRTVRAGGTTTFRARYSDQDSDAKVSGRNVTAPNTGDGSLVVDPPDASYALNVIDSSARSMKMEFVNDDNNDFDVTTLIVRGQKVTTYNREEVEVIDSLSSSLYGRHILSIDHKLLDDVDFADAIASYELVQRKDPRGIVRSIGINHRSADTIDFMINRTVGDWIRVVDDQTEHDDEYVIMGENHRWEAGDKHFATYILQATDGLNYIIIDETGKNEIDSGRYIAV